MKVSSFYVPISFFILTIILLVIPGSQFPKAKLFQIAGLDKVIHIGMFFLLTLLFSHPFKHASTTNTKKKIYFLQIAALALFYGIIMEFVQKYFVPNRSFEIADILVDGIGAAIGYVASRRYFLHTV